MPSWSPGEKKEIRGILGGKVFVGVTDGVQERTPSFRRNSLHFFFVRYSELNDIFGGLDAEELYQDRVTKPVSKQIVFFNKPIWISHRYCRLLDDLSLGEE